MSDKKQAIPKGCQECSNREGCAILKGIEKNKQAVPVENPLHKAVSVMTPKTVPAEAKTCAEMTHDEILVGKWFPESYVKGLEAENKDLTKAGQTLSNEFTKLEKKLAETKKDRDSFKQIALDRRKQLEAIAKTSGELAKYYRELEKELAETKKDRGAIVEDLQNQIENRIELEERLTTINTIINEFPQSICKGNCWVNLNFKGHKMAECGRPADEKWVERLHLVLNPCSSQENGVAGKPETKEEHNVT